MTRPLVVVDADVLGRQRTGDERYVLNLLRHLPEVAPDLEVAATTRHPELVPDGVRPVALRTASAARRMLVDLPRAARGAGVLHTQYALPPAWRGPAVVTVHDVAFAEEPQLGSHRDWLLLRLTVPYAVRRAALTLTVSEFSARAIARRYRVDPARVWVTPNGLDPGFGPDGPGPRRARPYVLVVGAIQPRKDPITALRAFALLDRDDLDLVFVGPVRRDGEEFRNAIVELGLRDQVHHLGHVAEDELAALYRGAEAQLFPTRYEGFGLPALEGLASGAPVVASDIPPVREIVGGAGVLCPVGDAEAFAAGLRTVLADRERFVRGGPPAAARFTWRAMAERTADAYRKALGAAVR